VALSLLSLRRLEISASLDTMLGLSSPAAQALHRVATEYQAGDGLLVIVDTPTGSEPDIPALAELAERLCRELVTDQSTAPLIRAAHYRADPALAEFAREVILPAAPYYLGPEAARELVSRLEPERLSAQFARNEDLIASPGPAGSALSNAVLRDPLRLADLIPGGGGAALSPPQSNGSQPEISIDGRAILIRVAPSFPSSDIDSAGALYSGARAIIDRLGVHAHEVRLGGPCAIAAVSSRTIRADAIVSTSVSVLLLYLLFVVFHRRWVAPVLIGITAGVGMLAGFGVFALFSRSISPLAAAVGALLAGLGVDYGIHFVSHFDSLRAGGADPQQGAIATARHMAVPIVTNCMTSIFGFASLLALADADALRFRAAQRGRVAGQPRRSFHTASCPSHPDAPQGRSRPPSRGLGLLRTSSPAARAASRFLPSRYSPLWSPRRACAGSCRISRVT
jgi:hypothetical protein